MVSATPGDAARSPAWRAALAEHDAELAAFLAAAGAVPDAAWTREPAPGRWSAAALALHVCDAYAFGVEAAAGRAAMRLRVPRLAAWISRTVLLPRLLASGRFPQGAKAPREVWPDVAAAHATGREALLARLAATAAAAAAALERAARERPATRITHAYFGPLPPLTGLRLLSAHTRHHVGGMRERGG